VADLHSERGTGVIGSLAGTIVFLALMLFGCQTLVSIFVTSTVSAAGFDAARSVASRQVDHADPSAVAAAEASAAAHLRALLGPLGRRAELTWAVGRDAVQLHIRVDSPAFVPGGWLNGHGTRHIDRTFVVRVEELR